MLNLSHIPVLNITRDTLKNTIMQRVGEGRKTLLFFANTNLIVKAQAIVSRLHSPDVMIVNDGIGVDIASWLVHGQRFKDNLNGTDFTPFYFEGNLQHKIYLIGSTTPDLEKAAFYFTHTLGQKIVGASDGFEDIKNPQLIDKINASGADVVLVGMGNPLQETWILDHYQALNAKLFMGVGALFVFLAGNKPRAPEWVRQYRLEWLFRMLLEPKRLVKRYTVDIVYFLYLCLKNKSATKQGKAN
ncbi:MAG: WecB/TagA/CpsF family glycosyltransferase [Methylophilus sp.]|uniref:WecB/TagA/CpsF family glycosyltransferase n=1 Tax=Methylophilus sp. TaxID=29541 RepID=UPI003F9F4EBE